MAEPSLRRSIVFQLRAEIPVYDIPVSVSNIGILHCPWEFLPEPQHCHNWRNTVRILSLPGNLSHGQLGLGDGFCRNQAASEEPQIEATGLSRFHSFSNGSKVYFSSSNAFCHGSDLFCHGANRYIKPWFRKLCLGTCLIGNWSGYLSQR